MTTGKDGAERIRDESSTYFARYRDGNNVVVERSDRMPGRIRRPPGARRPGASGRAGAGGPAHARRRSDRRAPDDADRRARRSLPEQPRSDGRDPEARPGNPPRSGRESSPGADSAPSPTWMRSAVEHWLNRRRARGASARTRNVDRTALIAFAQLVRIANRRLIGQPVPRDLQGQRDRRPPPPSPGDDRGRANPTCSTSPAVAPARCPDRPNGARGRGKPTPTSGPKCGSDSKRSGRERALIYKTLVLTGLRKNELATPDRRSTQARRAGPSPRTRRGRREEPGRERRRHPGRPGGRPPSMARRPARRAPGGSRRLEASRFRPAYRPTRSSSTCPTGLIRIFDRDLKAAGNRRSATSGAGRSTFTPCGRPSARS